MNTRKFNWGRVLFICLVFLLAGCEQTLTRHSVWIDVPLHNKSIPFGEPLHIEGHAADTTDVEEVQLWINDALLETISVMPTGDHLYHFEYDWVPPSAGEYELKVVSINQTGEASRPDTVHFVVGLFETAVMKVDEPSQDPKITTEPSLTENVINPSVTPEPSPTPDAVVQFYAEPDTIPAGQCSILHWHVENVARVIFGGNEQNFDGQFQACLCETQYYPLTVIYLDGREVKHTIGVEVTGSCETPTVVEITPSPTISDTTPPPAPLLLKPVDGVSLSCTASTTLLWEAVSDPSGINQYQVDIQRHSGDLNWQSLSGSPFGGLAATQYSVSVECGWAYRWRVRAVDWAGNFGSWSEWFNFTIPLS